MSSIESNMGDTTEAELLKNELAAEKNTGEQQSNNSESKGETEEINSSTNHKPDEDRSNEAKNGSDLKSQLIDSADQAKAPAEYDVDVHPTSTAGDEIKTSQEELNNAEPLSDATVEVVGLSDNSPIIVDEKKEEPSIEDSNREEHQEEEEEDQKNEQKIQEETEQKVQKETDQESEQKKQQEAEEKAEQHAQPESNHKNVAPVHGGLPGWMVQNANAPPSPSPEVDERKEEEQQTPNALQKGRGRGRGRRPAAEKAAALQEQSSSQSLEEASLQRPRRSTRTRIDYANPDAGTNLSYDNFISPFPKPFSEVTVLAEVDDEEPSGASKRPKGVRGRKPGPGKGRKRKTTETSEEEDVHDDDDDDVDYGSAKKKKKGAMSSTKRARGRPAGSKNKAGNPTKPTNDRRKWGRSKDKDSDDDEAEVVYDDRESDKEQTSDDEFEGEKISSNKTAKKSSATTPVQAVQTPMKKRGRPPGRRQTQQQTPEKVATEGNKGAGKMSEEGLKGPKLQQTDVEAKA